MNVIADDLSRASQILPTEWSLHQDMANHVFNILGQPNIDLFVTWYNHKCPTFVSPIPDTRALNTDALTMDGEGMFVYTFPPFPDSLHSASHSMILAEAELVPRPSNSVRENLHFPTSVGEAAKTAQVRCLPPKPKGT